MGASLSSFSQAKSRNPNQIWRILFRSVDLRHACECVCVTVEVPYESYYMAKTWNQNQQSWREFVFKCILSINYRVYQTLFYFFVSVSMVGKSTPSTQHIHSSFVFFYSDMMSYFELNFTPFGKTRLYRVHIFTLATTSVRFLHMIAILVLSIEIGAGKK